MLLTSDLEDGSFTTAPGTQQERSYRLARVTYVLVLSILFMSTSFQPPYCSSQSLVSAAAVAAVAAVAPASTGMLGVLYRTVLPRLLTQLTVGLLDSFLSERESVSPILLGREMQGGE